MAERRGIATAARSRKRRPYTIRDQVELRRLVGLAVSPDGSRVILRVENAAQEENRLDSHLWSVNADGRGLRQLTRSGGRNSDPVFPRMDGASST